jgi:nitrate reductase gamma subunit
MLLLIANTEFLLNGLFPEYISLSFLPTGVYYTLAIIFDIASILVLLSVIVAFIRRLAFPPSYIEARSPDAFAILSMVAVLMIAFFGMHASEIAHEGINAWYMPVSNFVASTIFVNISGASLAIYINIFWWIHALVLLAFLNYLPYSKHIHVLTSIFNCFFKNLEKTNTQPREASALTRLTDSTGKTYSTPIPAPNAAVAPTAVPLLPPINLLIPAW